MLCRHQPSARCGRRAVAAVELAVLLPFLGFIFVLAIDFARVFYYTLTLNNCARTGAYFGADYPGIYAYQSVTDAALEDGENMRPTATVTRLYSSTFNGPYNSTAPIPGGYVQVSANWQFNTITNYPGVPSQLNLQPYVRMQMAPVVPISYP